MYRIGVDLGGTNISAGVIDDKLEIIGRGKLKTNCPREAELILADVAKAVELAAADAGIGMKDVVSIGIGTPGSVNKTTGYIEYANNLDFDKVPAKQILEARLKKTVYLDNDANCAALGEAVAGVGRGVSSFVAITLGTGVGSGIVLDGKIVTGVNDGAGEMGHMVIVADGERCTCGRRGCWERYASATALIQQTKDAMHHDMDSKMWELVGGDINRVSGRTSFDAMRAGDKTAKKVVDKYIFYLSVGIINIVNALQPEIICIGGGIGHEKENLLVPLRKYVARERYSIHADRQTEILSAQLGNDAGIIGAALLDR
ncbi:MAG: ROK family protein [Clostridia bacterium]|nr:ROK family protein [Clostridia bacterium]